MYEKCFISGIHPSRMLARFTDLWHSKSLCDATLEVGPVKVYAHRLVLFSACPGLIQIKEHERSSHLEIKLPPQISTDALNAFVHFCYTSVLLLTINNVNSVEILAQILRVEQILEFCRSYKSTLLQNGDVLESAFETTDISPVVVSVSTEGDVTKVSFLDPNTDLHRHERTSSESTASKVEYFTGELKGDDTELSNYCHREHQSFSSTASQCEVKGESQIDDSMLPYLCNIDENRSNKRQCEPIQSHKHSYCQYGNRLNLETNERHGDVKVETNKKSDTPIISHNWDSNIHTATNYNDRLCTVERKGSLYQSKPRRRLVYPSTGISGGDDKPSNRTEKENQTDTNAQHQKKVKGVDQSGNSTTGYCHGSFKNFPTEVQNVGKDCPDQEKCVNVSNNGCSYSEFSDLVDEYMTMESPLKDIDKVTAKKFAQLNNTDTKETQNSISNLRQEGQQGKDTQITSDNESLECFKGKFQNLHERRKNCNGSDTNELIINELQHATREKPNKELIQVSRKHHEDCDMKSNSGFPAYDSEKVKRRCMTGVLNCGNTQNKSSPESVSGVCDSKEAGQGTENVNARELKFCDDQLPQMPCVDNTMDLKIVNVTSLAGATGDPSSPDYGSSLGQTKQSSESSSPQSTSRNIHRILAELNKENLQEKLDYQQLMSLKKWGVNVFKEWLLKQGKPADFERLSFSAINSLLEAFYTQMQLKDDNGFSLNILKLVRQCLSKYLNDSPYKRNVKFSRQEEFRPSNRVYKRLYKQWRRRSQRLNDKDMEDSHVHPITITDLHRLYLTGVLSNENPQSLQRKVIFELLLHMKTIKNPCSALLELTKCSFQRNTDKFGKVCYTVTTKCHLSKTHQMFYIYEIENKVICPVNSLDFYLLKLASGNNVFFQKIGTGNANLTNQQWYLPQRVSKSTVTGFMSNLSEVAGLSRIYSFASVMKTSLNLAKLNHLRCKILNTQGVDTDVKDKCFHHESGLHKGIPPHPSPDLQYLQSLNLQKEACESCSVDHMTNSVGTENVGDPGIGKEQERDKERRGSIEQHLVARGVFKKGFQYGIPQREEMSFLPVATYSIPSQKEEQEHTEKMIYSVDKDGNLTTQSLKDVYKVDEQLFQQRSQEDEGDQTNCHKQKSLGYKGGVMKFSSVCNTYDLSLKESFDEKENFQCKAQDFRIYKDGEQIKPLDLSMKTVTSRKKHQREQCPMKNSSFSSNEVVLRYVPPKKRRHEIVQNMEQTCLGRKDAARKTESYKVPKTKLEPSQNRGSIMSNVESWTKDKATHQTGQQLPIAFLSRVRGNTLELQPITHLKK